MGRAGSQSLTAENNYATKSPTGYDWILHIYPRKLSLSLRRSLPPSNTPIPRSTPFTTPNGIQIQSAVFPQFTQRTDRQTGVLLKRLVIMSTEISRIRCCSDRLKRILYVCASLTAFARGQHCYAWPRGLHARLCHAFLIKFIKSGTSLNESHF